MYSHNLTSWLETSEWSSLVIPSPMADFIKRDKEGNTLIGGYICIHSKLLCTKLITM